MAFDRSDTQSAQVVPSSRTTPRLIGTWTGLCRLQANRRQVCASHPTSAARPTQPPPLVPPTLSPTGSMPAPPALMHPFLGPLPRHQLIENRQHLLAVLIHVLQLGPHGQ